MGDLVYAVWIEGKGWLRDDKGNVFADLHKELADGAAQLWGRGASVVPFDESMLNLEQTLLQRARARKQLGWLTGTK